MAPTEDIDANKALNKTQLLFLYGDPYDISDDEKDRQQERLKNGTDSQAAKASKTKTSEGLKPTAETEDQPDSSAEVSDSKRVDLDISTGSASRDRVSHQQDLSIRPALGDVDVPPGTFQPLRMVSAQGLTQKIDDSNQEPVRLAGSETIPLSDEGAWDMQTVGAMPDVEARSSSDSEAKLKEANEQIKKLDRDLAQQYGHAAARHEIIASLRKRVKELETEQKVSARDLSTVFDQLHDQTDLMNSMIGLVEERDRLVKEKGDFLIRERDFQGGIARIRKALGLRDAELRKIQNTNARQSGDDAARDAMEYVRDVEERANVAEKLVKELRQQLKELDY